MIDANVAKKDNTPINLTQLTGKERGKLHKSITGHGKLKAALLATGLNTMTLKRAAAGLKLKIENAESIRTFLNSL
jgi:hypothetical protein